jgi:hypothetical protein
MGLKSFVVTAALQDRNTNAIAEITSRFRRVKCKTSNIGILKLKLNKVFSIPEVLIFCLHFVEECDYDKIPKPTFNFRTPITSACNNVRR